jgi:hypothetical protein
LTTLARQVVVDDVILYSIRFDSIFFFTHTIDFLFLLVVLIVNGKFSKRISCKRKTLIDPYKDHKEKAQAAGVNFEDLKEAEDHDYSDDEEKSDYNIEATATMSAKKATASK